MNNDNKFSVGIPIGVQSEPVAATMAVPVTLVAPAPINSNEIDERIREEWFGSLSSSPRSAELVFLAGQIARQNQREEEAIKRLGQFCKQCFGFIFICTGATFLLYSLAVSGTTDDGTKPEGWMPIVGIIAIFVGAFMVVLASGKTHERR